MGEIKGKDSQASKCLHLRDFWIDTYDIDIDFFHLTYKFQ